MVQSLNSGLKQMIAAYGKGEITLGRLNDHFYLTIQELDEDYDMFKYPEWKVMLEDPSGLRADWIPLFKKVYAENYERVEKEHQK